MWLLRSLKLVAILTPLFPASVGYALCRVIGLLFFTLNFKARGNILANLRTVDPQMTLTQRYLHAARVCITIVVNYYDLLRLRSVDRDSVLDLVDINGLEHVERALERGRGVIIVSGHIGNFSVMARLPAALGLPAALIAERVEPEPLYRYMARLRSAMGIEVIPPGPASLRRVLTLLDENGLLLLAADRDVTNRGLPVRFFGRETTLPGGPVALAMRSGAVLLPAYTNRVQSGRSRVEIWEPVELETTGDWEGDLARNLELLASHLETMIRVDLGQWAVLQRVWPPTSKYGRSEALGSADDYLGWNVNRVIEKKP